MAAPLPAPPRDLAPPNGWGFAGACALVHCAAVRQCRGRLGGEQDPGPKMAAPSEAAAAFPSPGDGGGGGFGSWLDGRLEALGLDRAVYGAYILGVLQEEEEEEKLDTLQCILSAFLVRGGPRSARGSPLLGVTEVHGPY